MTTLQVKTEDLRAGTNVPITREALLRETLRPINIESDAVNSLYNTFSNSNEGSLTEIGVQSSLPALYLANALAWIPRRGGTSGTHTNDNSLLVEVDEWFVMGYKKSDLHESLRLSQFKVDLQVHGYGYGYVDTATQLALAVIIAYCSIVVVYTTYSITIGHSSVA